MPNQISSEHAQGSEMDKKTIYQVLEKEFLATFSGELIPGVLHNFANPLNGIMGRAKLLQRRFDESIKKMEAVKPGLSDEFGAEKIERDITIIGEEADRFFHLFGDLSNKFTTLNRSEPERINFSKLIEQEMRFADFYLDLKHEVQKELRLERELPEIMFSAGELSLCLTLYLISAKERMKNSPRRELIITTSFDQECVTIMLEDSGEPISETCSNIIAGAAGDFDYTVLAKDEQGIGSALFLLKQNGFKIDVTSNGSGNRLVLQYPRPVKK